MTGSLLAPAAVIALLAAAAAAVFWPLRDVRKANARREHDYSLELARDSKLGEINDLELDYRLGKLSTGDYQALNTTLRAEAVEIIRRLESSAAASNGAHATREQR